MMNTQTFSNNLAYGHARTKRSVRVLEHNLHIATQRFHLSEGVVVDVLANETDPTF